MAKRRTSSTAPKPDTVVGIGASAGGLSALKEFFRRVPADSGLTFVVIVHLSPDHESHLATVLQPHARLPVQQVTETIALQANHIYLIPPGANLEAIDTHLRLSELEARRRERAPVDHFFRTLAEMHDGNAVGVILTGTGSDGALGIKAIKEKGGFAIVQEPNDAEYDGMPQAALATGVVDLILPLEQIPDAILRLTHTEPNVVWNEAEPGGSDEMRTVLQKIFAQIRAHTGRDFTRYKPSTLLRRITRRMQLLQLEQLSDYHEYLQQRPEEVRGLADDVLVTVTNFFRDPGVYERIEKEILPTILAQKARGEHELRVWAVGCATGEEAYSLAMLCLEAAARHDPVPRIQVFATDLHEHSLERARHGFYPGEIETDVSEERLRRFFVKEEGGYRVRKEARDLVIFAHHNLLSDPPFSRLDLISCRNLLIYLQREAQQQVDELFHYALRPGGFLVLGSSEGVVRSELFLHEGEKSCVYRRRDVPTPEPRLPVFPARWPKIRERDATHEPTGGHASYGEIHLRLLERHGPPSLLIRPDDRVVNLSGQAGRYLHHPSGELTASVFKLVREELRVELRAAISDARRSGEEMRTTPVRVQFNGDAQLVVLRVRPSRSPNEAGFILVLFDEWDAERADTAVQLPPAHGVPEREAEREAERELELVRHQLQGLIEEYETSQEMRASNEELQSANEELRSTMEELEASKEELHSMNEELQTINQENRHKVEELAHLSSDLQNLLAGTEIATLFLDRDLRIMRFTPRVSELFNVRATDRGRPLSDITHRLGYDQLLPDATSVLAQLVPVEREVQAEAGRWYLARLLPYRSTSDRIDGVVVTFVDISAIKAGEEALRQSETRVSEELATLLRLHELVARLLVSRDLRTALDEVLDATIGLSRADMGHIQLFTREGALAVAAHRGFEPELLEQFSDARLGDGSASSRALELRQRVIVHDVRGEPSYAAHHLAAVAAGYRGVQSTPLISRDGERLGVLSTHYAQPYHPTERDLRALDLYAHQAAEFIEHVRRMDQLDEKTRRLEAEDQRKSFFLAALGHELRNPLSALSNAMSIITQGIGGTGELQPMMASQVDQLKRLVDDLLEISRITRGAITLRRTPTDLVQILRRAAQSVAGSVGPKSQRVALPDAETFPFHGDEMRLEQLMSNLLMNASKYSPVHTRVDVALRRENDEAVIVVRDEGRGLKPEDLRRIFEPFEQLERGAEGGLGIGLALAKHLVDLHGGSIDAASDGPDRGSVFTIRLPIEEPHAVAAAHEAASAVAQLPSGTRVLIVDDRQENADTLALLLETRGAEVRCAYSGVDGLEQARAWQPHAALVDIGLPDITGYEVARCIREERGEQILLLAITGFGDPAAAKKALEAGFAERLVKPIDQERVETLIRQHVEPRGR